MYRVLMTTALVATGSAAQADDCAALGLSDPGISELFCAELKALGAGAGTARGIARSETGGDERPALDEWSDVVLIQDAYRQDPRKTLDLIRRIKDAGGLAPD